MQLPLSDLKTPNKPCYWKIETKYNKRKIYTQGQTAQPLWSTKRIISCSTDLKTFEKFPIN